MHTQQRFHPGNHVFIHVNSTAGNKISSTTQSGLDSLSLSGSVPLQARTNMDPCPKPLFYTPVQMGPIDLVSFQGIWGMWTAKNKCLQKRLSR